MSVLLDGDGEYTREVLVQALTIADDDRCLTAVLYLWARLAAVTGDRDHTADRLRAALSEFTRLGAGPGVDRAHALLSTLEPGPIPGPGIDPTDEPGSDAAPSPSTPAMVRAFGPLTLARGSVETRVDLGGPGRALRYLIAHGGSVRADQLIDALWPDASQDAGRTRLRALLYRLRARYGPLLRRDGPVIRWVDDVHVDVHRFTRLARTALGGERDDTSVRLAREAIDLYTSELLPLARDSEWAVTARERLRQRYLDLLRLLADDAIARDDLTAAIGYARKVIDTDPLDEPGYLLLARLHLDAGHPGQARDTITAAEHAAAELGLPISADLARLKQRLPRPAMTSS